MADLVYESSFAVACNRLPRSLADAQKIAHDTVIETSGRARTSGVTWTTTPVQAWRERFAELGLNPNAETGRMIRSLAVMFPLGVLVQATVTVDPEVSP